MCSRWGGGEGGGISLLLVLNHCNDVMFIMTSLLQTPVNLDKPIAIWAQKYRELTEKSGRGKPECESVYISSLQLILILSACLYCQAKSTSSKDDFRSKSKLFR